VTCQFAVDDGAYVLGSLAPADRAAFERHLPGCPTCREAVAALAVLPGLLGRLDAATAVAVGPEAGVSTPPTLLPRALAAAAAQRRRAHSRRRRHAVAAGVAAACLAAAVGVAVHAVDVGDGPPGIAMTAMRPVSDNSPVSADVGLVAIEGGSRVDMTCRYASGYSGHWVVRLVVFPEMGAGEQIGSWTAASGQEIVVQAITHLAPDEIARVEVQRADRGVLLTWSPP